MMQIADVTLEPVTMDAVIATSFKDYHVKGFDYVCLKRSERETIKLYFFDGEVNDLPEVVSPHDHRYDFATTCLAGLVTNRTFYRGSLINPHPKQKRYQKFEYRTPLNGGNGFTWAGEIDLFEGASFTCDESAHYLMDAHDLHTIQIRKSDTILMLQQFEDVLPVSQPTQTFTQSKEPPPLSGLYSRFTPDQIIAKLDTVTRLTGHDFRSLVQ